MKYGPGTLTLAKTNAFSGGTMINAGVIVLGVNNALPIAGGLTLGTTGGNRHLGHGRIQPASGRPNDRRRGDRRNQIIGNGAVSGTSTLTYSNSGGSTFAGTIQDGISGNGGQVALTVAAGLLNLSGSNTYGGVTTIQGGTLQLGSATALYAGVPVNGLVDNGTLDLAGNNFGAILTGSGTVINSATTATLTLGINNVSNSFAGGLQGGTLT